MQTIAIDEAIDKITSKNSDLMSIEDMVIANYLIGELNFSLRLCNNLLANGAIVEDKELFIARVAECEKSLSKLIPYDRLLTLSSTIDCLYTVVEKNPNRLDGYDYLLCKALHKKLLGFSDYVIRKCCIVTFGKKSNVAIRSFKGIPHKKRMRNFYFALKRVAEIPSDIQLYSIWTESDKKVSGLTIHRDRKKYLKLVRDFSEQIEHVRDPIKEWVLLPEGERKF